MRHLGLFEGIGGFSIAAQQMDWETVAWCEINEFCQTVLKYYFPKAQQHNDITTTDFSVYRGKIDIITGGFPCQPFSVAGKQLGTEDNRHLWPEMLRAIREVAPRWVVGENVRGLINWDGGMVFDQVQADLESEGYEVLPFLLPACSINAPHRRDRVWFIAYSNSSGQQRSGGFKHSCNNKKDGEREADWDNCLFQGESVPHLYRHNDGLSSELAGITVSKHRQESIQAYGNAIVPAVALQIFKAIEQYEIKLSFQSK